jgi:hypothetical protein
MAIGTPERQPIVAKEIEKDIWNNAGKIELSPAQAILLAEHKKERDAVLAKNLSKNSRLKLAQDIDGHLPYLESLKDEDRKALENFSQEMKQERAMDKKTEDKTLTASKDEVADDEAEPQTRAGRMKRIREKTKKFFKDITTYKTLEDWMDKGVDKAMEWFNDVTDFIKKHISPIWAKFGDVPPFLKPTADEILQFEEKFKGLEPKVSLKKGNNEASDLKNINDFENIFTSILDTQSDKTPESLVREVAEKAKEQSADKKKKSFTSAEFLRAAKSLQRKAPIDDPDKKAEVDAPSGLLTNISILKNTKEPKEKVKTAGEQMKDADITYINSKFSAKYKTEVKKSIDAQISRLDDPLPEDLKTRLKTIKEAIKADL